jgi:RHS repeat-associated protein
LSPYFVFKEGSFTKHIYAGTERIVSQIGNGEFNNNSGGLGGNGITAGSLNFAQVQDWYEVQKEKYRASVGVPPGPPAPNGMSASQLSTGKPWPDVGSPLNSSLNTPPKGWPKMPVFNPPGGPPGPPVQFGPAQTNDSVNGGYGYSGTGTFEEDRYFYHHDHLGSSSYLTNQLGNITQHVEYIPFGEVFVEERNEKWNTPYLFNGKELDEETGLYYYGARYYSSKESVWLSVDPPLINGYYLDGNHDGGVYNSFNLAAYAYCRQNPVIYIDPDGNQFKVVNGFWQVSTFEKNSYGSNWGMNVLNYVGNVSAEIGNFGIGIVNTGLYYGQSALKGQSQNIVNNEVSGLKAIGGLFEGSLSGAVASWGTTDYWEGFGADATLTLLGGLVSGAGKSSAVSSVSTGTAAKGGLRSFDDVVASPKSLWGKSADEIGNMLGEGWTKGAYGSKGTGWKFTKGDQSIFYHPGGGRHGGSYYGFSSGKLGKNKIVGPDYKPSPSDKATIINTGN